MKVFFNKFKRKKCKSSKFRFLDHLRHSNGEMREKLIEPENFLQIKIKSADEEKQKN